MSRANESAPGPGRSQRHVDYDSANATASRGRPSMAGIQSLALTPANAARAIDVSEDFFNEHIRPEVRCVRRGRKVLVAVAELERWLSEAAARTLEERR